MKKVIVTGGAGYIGSHLVQELVSRGHKVSVIDNLSTGFKDNVPSSAEFIKGDLCDAEFVNETLSRVRPDAVVHLAGKISVPESMTDPLGYFHNYVTGSLNLLESMKAFGIYNLILRRS